MKTTWLVLLVTVSVSVVLASLGCARVEVTQLSDASPYKSGLRFYRGAPYLVVSHDDGGNPQVSLIYLPDQTQEYVARITGGIGTASLTGKLEGGMLLTELGAVSDSKVPETLTALLSGAKAMKALAPGGLDPGLYELVYEQGKVSKLRKLSLAQQ